MRFNKIMLIVGICIFTIIMLGLMMHFLVKTRIVVLNEIPERERFPSSFESSDTLGFDIVRAPEDAINVAKAAIKSVYNESSFHHRMYFVYFDSETEKYFIVSYGNLLHAEVYVVVNQNDGSIAFMTHGKF